MCRTYKESYLKDMRDNAHTIMSKEKQIEFVKKYKETGDVKYFDALITSNLRYIYDIAKRFKNDSLGTDELISSGCCGMTRAIEKFDESSGASFLTYARWWIEHYMRREVRQSWSVIKMPDRVWYLMKKAREMKKEGKSPCSIAEECGSSKSLTVFLLNYKNECSLDEEIVDFGGVTLESQVGNSDVEYTSDLMDYLHELIDELGERKANIVKMRFGIGYENKFTLDEVAKIYGITRERVRQIQNNALDELKRKINKDNHI